MEVDDMLNVLASMFDVANIRTRTAAAVKPNSDRAPAPWRLVEFHSDGFTMLDRNSGEKFKITVERVS